MSIHRLVILQTTYGQKKNFSTFSYKLVQISPIMILVNSGAFLSISSWFCELTELIFVMIPYIYSTGYPPPPTTQGIMGHVQVANKMFSAHTTPEEFKSVTITGHFGFVYNHDPKKLGFQMFSVHTKTKSRRFKIPPV